MQNIIFKMTENVIFIFVKNTFFLFVTFLQNLCIKQTDVVHSTAVL